MNHVVGLFDDGNDAQRAIEALRARGIPNDRISVMASDTEGAVQKHRVDESGNIAAEGAVSGLASGAVVGGILGLLIGAGALFVPGGILVAGPIAGLVTGAAAGAATGGILGGLIGMGIPREHADVYAEGIRRGGVLVAVDGNDPEIDSLMQRHGAVDIEHRGSLYREQGWTGFDPNAAPFDPVQVQEERDRYRPRSVDTDSLQNRPLVGNDVATSIPGSSGVGATGGSLTDTSTGLGLGSVGLSTPGMGSTMSGNPASGVDVGAIGAATHDAGHTGDEYPEVEYANTGEAQAGNAGVDTVDRMGSNVPMAGDDDASLWGESMRQDARFAGRDWSSIEAEMRMEWEATHTEPWDSARDRVAIAWMRPPQNRANLL